MVKVRFIWLGLAGLTWFGRLAVRKSRQRWLISGRTSVSWAARAKDTTSTRLGRFNRDLDAQDNGCTEITYRLSGIYQTDTPGDVFAGSFGWYDARQHGYFGSTDEAMPFVLYGGSPAAVSAIPRSIFNGSGLR